jgi:D-xylose 1-dehydrogenase (NADP+, D-xylono-1,5-lactone-forming)
VKLEKVRWGVLSTANIGRAAVVPALRASTNGKVVAVASRDHERARAFAEANGIPRALGGYEALLEDPGVDALYVPLPNSMHRDWVVRAAEAGKHVLCEKPLALDASECRDMANAAAEHGVKLMEAFMYRFHPRTERVVEAVREGLIGQVGAVRSAFTFRLTRPDDIRLDPALGGGALMDVGCYCVNVSRTVLGEEPEEVQAIASWTARGVDDRLAGLMRFPGGAVAHFDCGLTLERCEYYEVAGTDGVLRADAAFLPGTDDVVLRESRGRAGSYEHTIPGADEYRLMVEHFADCVLNDRSPRWAAEEAAANVRVIEALYRSARAGGAVERV